MYTGFLASFLIYPIHPYRYLANSEGANSKKFLKNIYLRIAIFWTSNMYMYMCTVRLASFTWSNLFFNSI